MVKACSKYGITFRKKREEGENGLYISGLVSVSGGGQLADFQKQEISSWLLILMGALGTVISLFEGRAYSLGGWFGGIFLGLALLFLAFVTREEIGYGDGWLVCGHGNVSGFTVFLPRPFYWPFGISALVSGSLLISRKVKRNYALPFCAISAGRFSFEFPSVRRDKDEKRQLYRGGGPFSWAFDSASLWA